jgi:hypothetical protein
MNPAVTQRETLEVFIYTWPRPLLALIYSSAVALGITLLFVLDWHFIDWFTQWLGSWAIPIAAAIGIYALAGMGLWQMLYVRLRRPRSRPSLVAERTGLSTPWSVQIPWDDIDIFLMGTAFTKSRGGSGYEFPSAVVPNIAKYWPRAPWRVTTMPRWAPANAFPVIQYSGVGYLVRRDGVDPLKHVGNRALIAELSSFQARMRNIA